MALTFDIVTIILLVVVIFALNLVGYFLEMAVVNVAAMCLSVYCTADVFSASAVTIGIAYNSNTAAFVTYTVDPNIFAILFAVLAIVSALFIFYSRSSS